MQHRYIVKLLVVNYGDQLINIFWVLGRASVSYKLCQKTDLNVPNRGDSVSWHRLRVNQEASISST